MGIEKSTRGSKDRAAKVEGNLKALQMGTMVDPETGKLTKLSEYHLFHTGHNEHKPLSKKDRDIMAAQPHYKNEIKPS
jgi:hypothetical protein